MSDQDLEDDDEVFDFELFDTSDVKFRLSNTNTRRRISLIAECESGFNLVKYYLALKEHVDKIRVELNIMEESEGEH